MIFYKFIKFYKSSIFQINFWNYLFNFSINWMFASLYKWEYVFIVVCKLSCPSRLLIAVMSAWINNKYEAWECLKSWRRILGKFACKLYFSKTYRSCELFKLKILALFIFFLFWFIFKVSEKYNCKSEIRVSGNKTFLIEPKVLGVVI